MQRRKVLAGSEKTRTKCFCSITIPSKITNIMSSSSPCRRCFKKPSGCLHFLCRQCSFTASQCIQNNCFSGHCPSKPNEVELGSSYMFWSVTGMKDPELDEKQDVGDVAQKTERAKIDRPSSKPADSKFLKSNKGKTSRNSGQLKPIHIRSPNPIENTEIPRSGSSSNPNGMTAISTSRSSTASKRIHSSKPLRRGSSRHEGY
eukprot:gb/GEZJ01004591.1/.p1 GENE.gb/GEZJ01004591.1/~~gb/GEZJ01004591.1/.p1  ORF type:complete len:203 (-),score=25.77 gb/GEZJ01004591.1/:1613-2221(-)